MYGPSVRKLAINLLLALFAVAVLVSINEAGYQNSHRSIQNLDRTHAASNHLDKLLHSMLNMETGLRGYLLTGDQRYLAPYIQGTSELAENLRKLNTTYSQRPNDLADFTALAQQITLKVSEMDLSLKLRSQDNEDAWKFVLSTDIGLKDMESIRTLTERLSARNTALAQSSNQDIVHSLWLSRIGITAAALIGLFAFYMYLRKVEALRLANEREQRILANERDVLEVQVRERTASLAKLATHLQQVREEERSHLARELHDELGALLTAAKLDVARLKSRVDMGNPEITDRLMHLVESLNAGIALKRRIIEDLRPSSLSNLGLTASLEILTHDFADRTKMDVRINIEAVQLSSTAQLTVYRLIQESLTNIGKYANATSILVTVHDYATHMSVQVRDNGEGFDTAAVPAAAHGLAGMRHRVEAAGGKLSVTSTVGEGTLVSATLPHSNDVISSV